MLKTPQAVENSTVVTIEGSVSRRGPFCKKRTSWLQNSFTRSRVDSFNFSSCPLAGCFALVCVVCAWLKATNSNAGPRAVEVAVELGGRGASFLVVKDNGRGMNASGLKDFATYFLTQVLERLPAIHGFVICYL